MNINYSEDLFYNYYFEIYCADINGWESYLDFDERNGKKHYDGTITYTLDISNKDCHEFFEIDYYYGDVDFKNITIEYQEKFISFYFNGFKVKVINDIN